MPQFSSDHFNSQNDLRFKLSRYPKGNRIGSIASFSSPSSSSYSLSPAHQDGFAAQTTPTTPSPRDVIHPSVSSLILLDSIRSHLRDLGNPATRQTTQLGQNPHQSRLEQGNEKRTDHGILFCRGDGEDGEMKILSPSRHKPGASNMRTERREFRGMNA